MVDVLTDSRTLEDQRRAEGAAANDNLLSSPVHPGTVLAWGQRLSWNRLDPNGTTSLDDHLLNLGVAHKVKVRVLRSRGMNVSVRRVRATTSIAVNPFQPVFCAVTGDPKYYQWKLSLLNHAKLTNPEDRQSREYPETRPHEGSLA